MQFTVIVHEAEEGGYWVEVPALPGCFSQGETVDEALHNTQRAIGSHVEALREDGEPIPVEGNVVLARLDVAVPEPVS